MGLALQTRNVVLCWGNDARDLGKIIPLQKALRCLLLDAGPQRQGLTSSDLLNECGFVGQFHKPLE